MEAKGCAKPTIWKNARRHFYWALRAKLARSKLLNALISANPSSAISENQRLIDSLLPESPISTQEVAETLERADVSDTLTRMRSDALVVALRGLVVKDRKAALEGIARVLEELSEEEKSGLGEVLMRSLGSGSSKGSSGASRFLSRFIFRLCMS